MNLYDMYVCKRIYIFIIIVCLTQRWPLIVTLLILFFHQTNPSFGMFPTQKYGSPSVSSLKLTPRVNSLLKAFCKSLLCDCGNCQSKLSTHSKQGSKALWQQ